MKPNLRVRYDVIILGAGHNGLVAASYLARAGLSVLLLEKNEYIGGATTSQRIFPTYDAVLSRYSYLVSLLPEKIIRELGMRVQLKSRGIASFTPYLRDGIHSGLLVSNSSDACTRESFRALTKSAGEFEGWQKFYHLTRVFAEKIWGTMLEPLKSKAVLRRYFEENEESREAWTGFVEEPLGFILERYLKDDLTRGIAFTDAKIGLSTQPYDETRLQNRCFLYHIMGNGTGEWKVPAGGMGRVVDELIRVATSGGAEMLTKVDLKALEPSDNRHSVEFELDGHRHKIDARFVLVNFGRNVLAKLLRHNYEPDSTHEGSVLKINLLLRRLPRLLASGHGAKDAFCGTFHVDESYEQMKTSFHQSTHLMIPDKIPCELYCHTLTDDSILSSDLRTQGFHTLTLFALDVPWRLFSANNEATRDLVTRKCLDGLNRWLAEPIEDCLARTPTGDLCIESKTPIDLERELGHYRGNIFHGALTFPFADSAEREGTWGVETEFPNVFICGAGASRGGGVSGIPGHNAAMKVLENV